MYALIALMVPLAWTTNLLANTTSKEVLHLDSYLKNQFHRDLTVSSQKTALKEATVELEANDRLSLKTELSSQLFKGGQLLKLAGIETTGQAEGLRLGLATRLRTGTDVAIATQQNSGRVTSLTPDYLQTYQASLTQSLFFGAESRWTRQALGLKIESQKLKTKRIQYEQCSQLILNYTQAWANQENRRILENRKTLAADIYSKVRSAANTGRASQNNRAQTEADVLVLESQLLQAEKNHIESFSKMDLPANKFELQDPNPKFASWYLEGTKDLKPIEEIFLLQELKKSLESVEAAREVINSQQRPELNVKFEKTWFNGYQYLHDEKLSLNLLWAFDEPIKKSELQLNQIQSENLKITKSVTLENLSNIRQNFSLTIEALKQSLNRQLRRKNLLQSLEVDFRQRFLRGLIEFQTYSQVRDQVLALEIEINQTQVEVLSYQLKLLQLNNFLAPECGEPNE